MSDKLERSQLQSWIYEFLKQGKSGSLDLQLNDIALSVRGKTVADTDRSCEDSLVQFYDSMSERRQRTTRLRHGIGNARSTCSTIPPPC